MITILNTSISIARILDRLNSMYNNIGSRNVYLSSEGSAIDEIGGDRRSSSPLAVEERCRWWCDERASDGDDVPTLAFGRRVVMEVGSERRRQDGEATMAAQQRKEKKTNWLS